MQVGRAYRLAGGKTLGFGGVDMLLRELEHRGVGREQRGINAFDLVKTAEGWKIAGGIYTVESKCEPSPLGPLKQ